MRTEASTNFAKRMRFVLTPTQLKGLKEHKYSSQGISLLEYYALNSFWSWLVEFVPRWVAPNLITFVGFSASLVTTLAIILQDPNAEGKVRGGQRGGLRGSLQALPAMEDVHVCHLEDQWANEAVDKWVLKHTQIFAFLSSVM